MDWLVGEEVKGGRGVWGFVFESCVEVEVG